MQFQTRSEENGLNYFSTLNDALLAAACDNSVWKISFQLENGERVRLVRYEDRSKWIYESPLPFPIVLDKILKELAKK